MYSSVTSAGNYKTKSLSVNLIFRLLFDRTIRPDRNILLLDQKFRIICFTLNNYSEEEYLLHNDAFKYVIIGKEIGESSTPHLQGYGEFKKQMRFNAVKTLNTRMHFERRFGGQKEAINYCKKDNNYKDYGERRIQGQRTDLLTLR